MGDSAFQGHLAGSGGIFFLSLGGVGMEEMLLASNGVHLGCCNSLQGPAQPTTENHVAPNGSFAELEKLCSKPFQRLNFIKIIIA